MTVLADNILHLPEYRILGTKTEEHVSTFSLKLRSRWPVRSAA